MNSASISEKSRRGEAVLSQTDRAIFLARLLQKRGVSLKTDWREVLELTVRTYNVLVESGYATLADVLEALRNDGQEILRKKNFGRKSLHDLWTAVERLAGPDAAGYQSGLFESPGSSPKFLENVQSEPRWVAHSLSEFKLTRLKEAGVDPDQPWQNVLPEISTRLRRVLRERFVTLREVVIATTDEIETLKATKNLGHASVRKLVELLEMLAEHGTAYFSCGDQSEPPATIDELIERALHSLSEIDGRLLTRRFLERATLSQASREYNLTREGVRQKTNKILKAVRTRMESMAKELTRPLVEAAERAGGLLHRDRALEITATTDLQRVWLSLMIAGAETYHIWREEFLTTVTAEDLSLRLDAICDCFHKNRNRDLSLADAGGLVAASTGLRLDSAGLLALLTTILGYRITEEGFVTRDGFKLGERLEKLLRVANRPLHITEILANLYPDGSETAPPESLAELEEPEEPEEEEEENQPLNEAGKGSTRWRTLIAAITRHEDLYQSGPLTFIHVKTLPIPLEKLDEIVELCVARIDGETTPVSTEYLLKILRHEGIGHPGLNKYLLKDALSRRPEIVSFRKFRVGHAACFHDRGLRLVDRIEAILRQADHPLSASEIFERLPRNTDYSIKSATAYLRDAPFVVNVGRKYVHLQSLGLTEDQCRRLVGMALALLPPDGSPISSRTILDNLRSVLPDLGLADFANREDAADVLRGLLRLKADAPWGAGTLVGRRVEGKDPALLKRLILQVIRDAVVAAPIAIVQSLAHYYSERPRYKTVTIHLNEALGNHELRCLPIPLYFLPDIDENRLLDALVAHDQEICNLIDGPKAAELPATDLWLLVRYCNRQNDSARAVRLSILAQSRGDDT